MSPTKGAVLSDPGQIIEALGGATELAKVFGYRTHNVVLMWRRRENIPWPNRAKIKELLEAKGFSVPDNYLDHPGHYRKN